MGTLVGGEGTWGALLCRRVALIGAYQNVAHVTRVTEKNVIEETSLLTE